jgi:hypothetical protein
MGHLTETLDPRASLTKPGLGPFGSRLLQIFAEAIDGAAALGVSRESIAAKLGVSLHTVHAWMKSSSTNRTPFDRFFELACREDILPESVRDRLWSRMGFEAGLLVFPEERAEAGQDAALVQLAQVAAAFGRMAETLRTACSHSSTDGRSISKGESKLIVERLHELETDVARLRSFLSRDN